MAKKKGSQRKKRRSPKRKGKSSKPKKAKEEEVIEEVSQQEEETVPEPIPEPVETPMDDEIPPPPVDIVEDELPPPEEITEDDSTKLSDAVSAVIGGDVGKKEEKKTATQKKREKLLLQWTAEGYNIDELEALLASGAKKGVKKTFDDFADNVKKIENIKNEIEEMDVAGLDEKVESVLSMLNSPDDIENIETEFDLLKKTVRSREIGKELDGMVLDSVKDRVENIRGMLEDFDKLDEAEKALDTLKKDYKEAYFKDGVASFVKTEEPAMTKKKPAAKGKLPMTVRDIFLLYRDGRFISHHTGRVVPKEEQEQLFIDLKTGRNYLKSPNYKPQKLNIISVNNRKILVQGGQFTVVIMVTEGDVNPWTERIIGKVQTLLEKEDRPALQKWNGDVGSLKSAGKYMTALLYACMKLSKKGK